MAENKPAEKQIEPEYEWYDPFGWGEPSNKATIDAQNAKPVQTKTNTLAPAAPTATPPKPPAYEVKPTKWDHIWKVTQRAEYGREKDLTPEERMKAPDYGTKDNPSKGDIQQTLDFVEEVNRLNKLHHPERPLFVHDDSKDMNKAREIGGQFIDYKLPELEKKLGRKATNEEIGLMYHFGSTNINRPDRERYAKVWRSMATFQSKKEAEEARKKLEEIKAKAKADAAAKAKK